MILTGDLHANCTGELEFLKPEYLRNKFGNKCESTVIVILGDGGFLWHNDAYSDFDGELVSVLGSYLDELNSIAVVIPGNHENYKRIYEIPSVHINSNRYDGIVGEFRPISDKILYTERFGNYSIGNKSILVLGGALSIDREYRHEGEWFPEETFSIEEKQCIIERIRDNEYDYVLAHTCPAYISSKIQKFYIRDSNSEFFDRVMNWISPEYWFSGHFHPEKIKGDYNFGNFDNLKINNTKFKCMYKDIQGVI